MSATTEIITAEQAATDNAALTANQWAQILGVTPQAVRKDCGKGIIARDQLPQRWRDRVNDLMVGHSAASIAQLRLMLSTERHAVARPVKPFASKTAFAQDKAMRVRQVMMVYFETLGQGATKGVATEAARQRWEELFGKPCSAKTIARKEASVLARLAPAQPPTEAPLEWFTDNKDVPHLNARLEVRGVVPHEFIRAFRAKCVLPGMEHVSSAFRAFEIDWLTGKEVPGFGRPERNGLPFPVTIAQVRKYAPGYAARLQGSRGQAAARAIALPTMRRTNAELQLCEKIVFDDTRLNIFALDDLTGNVVELKSYWAMDVATRRIIGWLVREAGNVKASDVDALVARVLQTWGFAHEHAGYATELKFERGTVACNPSKQALLEGLYPGQIKVRRTSMDGGRNFDGDYQQAASGHWMGKGEIESFMRTLGYFCEHLKGQRGSVWQRTPAHLGTLRLGKNDRQLLTAGSILDEASLVARSGRALAYLQSNGLDRAPSAAEAAERFGLRAPLYYVHEVLAALPAIVQYYNSRTDHRREGFADVRYEADGGGIRFRKETSDERAARLQILLEARAVAPVVLPDSDAALLLHRARRVTVTRNGVQLQINGCTLNYWKPASAAIREAIGLTTGTREAIALLDEEKPDRIHLLQNTVSTWQEGDHAVYWETLPVDPRVASNDREAQAVDIERRRQEHNRVARELTTAIEPELRERDRERQTNLDTLRSVTVAHGGLRQAAPGTTLARQVEEADIVDAEITPTTRSGQRAQTEQSYAESLPLNETSEY